MLPLGFSQAGDRQISIGSDTGFFHPGLPGEVVRLRFPAYGAVYLIAWAMIAGLAIGGLYQLFNGSPTPMLARDLIGPAGKNRARRILEMMGREAEGRA